LGGIEAAFGFLDKSIETMTKGVELCEAAGNEEWAGYAYAMLQWNHLFKGNFEKVLTLKKDTLRRMDEQFNLRWYVYVVYCVASAYAALGRWDEAEEEGKKALGVAQEFTDNSLISEVASIISLVYILKGDLEQAIKYGELGVAKASTPADEFMVQAAIAWAWCRAGEANKGIGVLKPLAEMTRAVGMLTGQLPIGMYLSEGYLLAEEYDKAWRTAEELLEVSEQCGARAYHAMAHRTLGEVALKTRPDESAPHFEKAISLFKEVKAENEIALAYSGMGRYHKQQGNTAQAREYLTKALEIFERLGTLIEPDKVREELSELGD
jgi:tetratricopeptide (TPR) repeat protein